MAILFNSMVVAVAISFTTDPAMPLTSFEIGIGCVVWMALAAMREFCFYGGKAGSPKNVFAKRYGFKMCWVYALPISAKMIYDQSFRNSTVGKFIRDSVNVVTPWRTDMIALTNETCVAVWHNTSSPFPATSIASIAIYKSCKTFTFWPALVSHMNDYMLVMLIKQKESMLCT